MAWAVKFDSEIGKFSPDGHFLGFGEQLHAQFSQKMTAEEKATFRNANYYESWVFQKFSREVGSVYTTNLPLITSLKDHEWPTVFQGQPTSIRSLGSVIKLPNGVLSVDESMKGIIEILEPNIHQFHPITFLQPNSETFPGNYYTIVIGHFRDSFIPEAVTEGTLWKRSSYLDPDKGRTFTGKYTHSAATGNDYARLSFSSTAISGAHLWRERSLLGPSFFISDALYDAVTTAKMIVPPMFKVGEV